MNQISLYDPNPIATLMADGFTEGPPPHLSAEKLMADIDAYRRMACPACHKRRQRVLAFHRADDYALVVVCRACGFTTEP